MMNSIQIGNRTIGEGYPCFFIAEIGINHNGKLENVKKLIDVAVECGCDAVKFQKRTPEICVPEKQKNILRETPWGVISYLEYKKKIELGYSEYNEIDKYCKDKHILWFASCWDLPSVDFIEQFSPCCYKVASASLTDKQLLKKIKYLKRPVILSTGMSTLEEIDEAMSILDYKNVVVMQATSTYPAANNEINLKVIRSYIERYKIPVGYSGHEVGLQISLAAVAFGASVIERHITLDRTMWGTDQAASVEPQGLKKLIRDIRVIEQSMGDGVKKVYDSEIPIRGKLRNLKF